MSLQTEISNMSYTNKDFNSIYTELLEYAKKISYKWDPSSSDESDPGVVLLKLAAIIGDKDSYNIDKNVLELMPSSVSQLSSARQLFDQCGYTMRYYRAAEGIVNILIKKHLGEEIVDKTDYSYTVPMFTMFTDTESRTIYTSTKPLTIPVKTEVSIPVMEGVVVNYKVNNDPLITTQNLDSNNRIYFTENNIAENGIFITNVDLRVPTYSNYDEWLRVDNLYTQPVGSKCFKFGVSGDNSLCYIEFPDDIELLIGQGLNISYLLTNGTKGNINQGTISKFYTDTKFKRSTLFEETTDVDASPEAVSIRNPIDIINGQDPESIDDAYKHYKRVRDTFDTLVSLKDYTDYMVTNERASNGYVCDRTNDIQHVYKVVSYTDTEKTVKSKIDTNSIYQGSSADNTQLVEVPKMSAFDLCVYALEYVPVVTTPSLFKTSFNILDANSYMFSDKDMKSLQHEFKQYESNKILMLKNKYTVTANIVPKYSLSTTEKYQIRSNIETNLCKALNSHQMTFGEHVSFELIQNTILDSDERIKTLIDFASPKYETYAVYKDTYGDFKELRIDQLSIDGGFVETTITKSTFSSKKGETLYYKTSKDEILKVDKNASFDSSLTYYVWDSARSLLWNQFRTEIFAKNILAGITPLYTDDNTYQVSANQKNVEEHVNITSVSTNTNIKMSFDDRSWKSSLVRPNESILLTAPNFIEEPNFPNFSTYVKMLYFFNQERFNDNNINETEVIPADSKFELRDYSQVSNNDFIIFFWKESDASTSYTYVKYDATDKSLAKFFSPKGFNLPAKQNLSSTSVANSYISYDVIKNYFRTNVVAGKGTTKELPLSDDNFINNHPTYGNINNVTQFVEKCLKSDSNCQVLTGTKIMEMYNIHQIHINNDNNGCQFVYWILNNNVNNYATLFSDDDTSYTLKSGEYFLYTNDDKSTLYVLGEGTLIQRSKSWTDSTNASDRKWTVPTISYSHLLAGGIHSLDGLWYTVPRVTESKYDDYIKGLWATEQQQILLGPNNILHMYGNSSVISLDTTLVPKSESDSPQDSLDVEFYSNSVRFKQIVMGVDSIQNNDCIAYVDENNNQVIVARKEDDTYLVDSKYSNLLTLNSSTSDDIQNFFNIYFKDSKGELVTSKDFNITNVPQLMIGFNISYSDSVLNSTEIPSIDSVTTGWSVVSILNLNTSPSSPQLIDEYQSMILTDSEENVTEVSGTYVDNNYVPAYIQSDKKITMIGSSKIDLSALSGSNINILSYQSSTHGLNNINYDKNSGELVIAPVLNGDKSNFSLVFELLPGKYILQVQPSTPTASVSVTGMSEDSFVRIESTNAYKLLVSSTDDSKDTAEITLTFDCSGLQPSSVIHIPALFRYNTNILDTVNISQSDTDTSSFEDILLDKIANLDVDKEFSYTYMPENPIYNPLNSETFLQKDHFYNKFTICEWDTNISDNVRIHEVVR